MEERKEIGPKREFICIDIGGTAIKYGVITNQDEVLLQKETPTNAKILGGKGLAQKVHDLCKQLIQEFPNVEGIAISTAGVVDTEKTEIIHASNAIPGYIGVNYREELADLNLPVEVENDVNSAGLSEYVSGSAKGTKSALILTIGTGIGGCFIEEGRLSHGNTYSACEVGYIPIDGVAFQDQAATSALVRSVAMLKDEPECEWNGRRIFECAENGDEVCEAEIEKLARRIGKGIASLCFILNPQVVVLGGGIMARQDILRPWIEAGFVSNSIPLIAKNTEIRFASHQNAAGMKGALVHFLQKHPELA
ncbi:ROK family protein [Ileibacterium valens]|uniref:Sugar kinase n=1 Tax=Ileibacterium valens TaxID=1862668 RepID=A0A1U7NIT2_9FIRM|nr:ROK family protein [Ileibacterium valens]OLU36259.1 hypothetical protein BM735_12685 [Erysipelotrichaceae bacterium NYU-BL-F16]OLU42655.1 hypothetical protein BO222_01230 [Ileibacterium valens]OLU43409.1 hypothetical protein BO224_00175 [Erysipelotrichaceae bacterium NYU-BL-E8]